MKILGNFRTPFGVSEFGGVKIYDLRQEPTKVARWATLVNEIIGAIFVLLPADGPAIGEYKLASGYIKWNRSLKVSGNILMASWWWGADCSRSGRHGTQLVAYLDLDHGCANDLVFDSGQVKEGTLNFDGIGEAKSNSSFPSRNEQLWGAKVLVWHGLTLRTVPAFTSNSGYSPDHMRRLTRTVPGRVDIVMPSGKVIPIQEDLGLAECMAYEQVSQVVRDSGELSIELSKVLLSEDIIRCSEGPEKIALLRALVEIES